MKYHTVVDELIDIIKNNKLEDKFNTAIANAHKQHIPDIKDINTIDDYLKWINDFLHWVQSEEEPGKAIHHRLCKFYFILDQHPLLELQNKIIPNENECELTNLSSWMVKYAQALGEFLDTQESINHIESFYQSPSYNMNDYIIPHGGWKSFNQFFARNYKPGYRPIAAVSDQHIIVSPADSTFAGQWEIRSDSHVTVKNMHWEIQELMADSPYKERFTNGTFIHSFLGPNDYHRQHAPVGGKVLESRVIHKSTYFEVIAVPIDSDQGDAHHLKAVRELDTPDNAGYQFSQTRGLVTLDTPIGLVAILPIGMAQVSSVIMTAEVGVTLRKGEEISYFQFGGSDIIVLFEAASNVCFSAQPGVHYKMGVKIAQAYPVI